MAGTGGGGIAVSMAALPPRSGPMVDVRDLTVRFGTSRGDAQAVNGIGFEVQAGEVLGLIAALADAASAARARHHRRQHFRGR